MGSTYIDETIARLRAFEGSVDWMYLDTVGKVTVGVGLMLPSSIAASTLPFTKGERPATPAEIAAEYRRVSELAKGRPAKFYSKAAGIRLPEQAIEQRLREALQGFEGYLRSHIAGYDALPDAAKMGLLDMVYNLGPGKLFAEYPRLLHAVAAGDWKTAAAASHRRGPGEARNAWTQQQFLSAASAVATDIKASGESYGLGWFVVGCTAVAGTVFALRALERAGRRQGSRHAEETVPGYAGRG